MTSRKTQAALIAIPLCLALTLPVVGTASTDPEKRGLEIAQEADLRDQGFVDSKSTLKMTLRNQHGENTLRKMRNRTLEQENDGDKSIIIFDDPKDVKGTAFLSFTRRVGADDQWIYLPVIKRVKRISSSNKAGPFMGSEFAYEDLSSQEVQKYTYRYEGNETFDGRDHYILKRFPVNKNSGYTHQIVWLDKDEYRTWKIDYFDRKGALLKTLNATDFQIHKGKYWRPGKLTMVNHQTGKSTELAFSDFQFSNGFSDREFTKSALARMR